MKYLKTNKLFYKKWPFKVECYLRGANRIKYNGIESVIGWCSGITSPPRSGWWDYDKNIDKSELLKFAHQVKPYLDKDLQIRTEGGRFNIFCKDPDLLENIIKDMSVWINTVYEPSGDDTYNFLVSNNGNKILCEEYPWDGYHYKVILRERMAESNKASFSNWINRYPGKIRIADSSLHWLNGKKRWMQDPFVYVKDSSTLTMVMLFLGNDCRKTHEYILRSSINTPCPH
jgi:hypothetical protein